MATYEPRRWVLRSLSFLRAAQLLKPTSCLRKFGDPKLVQGSNCQRPFKSRLILSLAISFPKNSEGANLCFPEIPWAKVPTQVFSYTCFSSFIYVSASSLMLLSWVESNHLETVGHDRHGWECYILTQIFVRRPESEGAFVAQIYLVVGIQNE